MLTKLAIWYLRKRKCSLVINVKIDGSKMQAKGSNSFIYDNSITGLEYYDKSGNLIVFPNKSRFHFKTESNDKEEME